MNYIDLINLRSDLKNYLSKKGNYVKHHYALCKGYVQKESGYVEKYNGKYGFGYKIHWPNNSKLAKTNNYHKVEYLTTNEPF